MEAINVFLDTSVICAERYKFEDGPLLALHQYADKLLVRIHTSSIVLREIEYQCKHRLTTYARETANRLVNSLREQRIDGGFCAEELRNIVAQIKHLPQQILRAMRDFFAEATPIEIANVSTAKMFDRFFDCTPPFKGNERKRYEFPDAAIVLSVLEFVNARQDFTMHIVSTDKGMQDAFKNEEGIVVHTSLADFLQFVSQTIGEYRYALKSFCSLTQMDFFKEEIQVKLIEEARQYVSDDFESIYSGDDWTQCSSIELDTIDLDEDPSLILVKPDVIYLDDDPTIHSDDDIRTCTGIVYGKIECKFNLSYLDYSESQYERIDGDGIYNVGEGEGKVHVEAKALITASISYLNHPKKTSRDDDIPELISLDIDNVVCETLETELKEPTFPLTDYDDPWNWVDSAKVITECPQCGGPITFDNDGGNGFCSNCASDH